jgi:hypothetical protein
VTGDIIGRCDLLCHGSDSVAEALPALVKSVPQSAGSTLEARLKFPEFGRELTAETVHGATANA